jgi:hypothetical protein
MADYKGIKGFKVQYLSADPSDPNIGQTWYNSTSKDLKYTGVTTAGAWATGGNLGTARLTGGGAGTQNAAVTIGGYNGSAVAISEEYDGSVWTSAGSLGTGRWGVGGQGTQTAALCVAGVPSVPTETDATEEYDGTSWAAGGAYPTPVQNNILGAGVQTAALNAGGSRITPPGAINVSAEYNGTAWTAGNSLNTAKLTGMLRGVQTAAFYAGGRVLNSNRYIYYKYRII